MSMERSLQDEKFKIIWNPSSHKNIMFQTFGLKCIEIFAVYTHAVVKDSIVRSSQKSIFTASWFDPFKWFRVSIHKFIFISLRFFNISVCSKWRNFNKYFSIGSLFFMDNPEGAFHEIEHRVFSNIKSLFKKNENIK